MSVMHVIFLINYISNIVNGFISHGFYALTDYRYDGFLSNGANNKYLCGSKNMLSEENYYSLISAKECQQFCLNFDACRSFVIDRDSRICHASTFDRCNSSYYMTPLQYRPTYVTYDIIPDVNEITKTCFQQCLDSMSGNCSACGRMWCSGMACDNCTKTCWDLEPTINATTYFWRSLNETVAVTCNEEWQLAYKGATAVTYKEMHIEPLWLQLIVTLSNGSSYNSYFSNVTLSGSSIEVGNYLGGPAGNFWNAPGTFYSIYFGNTTCEQFFYKNSFSCNITKTQIKSFDTQIQEGTHYNNVKRGYVWKVCNHINDSATYVQNIELYVTSINYTLDNSRTLTTLPLC